MKKVEPNRYPHSATLFKFCKRALELKYPENTKVIDQDVGGILGYDPADCSHWKKGKKNIRALGTIRSIADHLNIDDRLLIDVAAGQIGLEEALFEYQGYGNFTLSQKRFEDLKKEYFLNPKSWGTGETHTRSFEEMFDINRPAIHEIVQSILSKGNFQESPIYIPELFNLFEHISLERDDTIEDKIQCIAIGEAPNMLTKVQYKGEELRPFMRFIAAKQLFVHLAKNNDPIATKFAHQPDEVLDIQANIFAGMLLVPGDMLRNEVTAIDSSIDIISQLSQQFWVSKSLMNLRLGDYLENLN